MGPVNATRRLVDLTRFRSNIAAIRKKLPTRIKLLVVVKSNAYGHGLVKIVKEAQSVGVKWLGVASLPPLVHLGASEALVYYREAVIKPPPNFSKWNGSSVARRKGI